MRHFHCILAVCALALSFIDLCQRPELRGGRAADR